MESLELSDIRLLGQGSYPQYELAVEYLFLEKLSKRCLKVSMSNQLPISNPAVVQAATDFVIIGVNSVDVTTGIASWATDPQANRGWIFLPTGGNGVDLRSSEHSTIVERPKLEVVFNFTATPSPDAPTAIDEGPYSVTEDTSLTVGAPGVLGNDSDPDGDPITRVLGTPPANGSLILNTDGSFTYTPDPEFSGNDSFGYRANDGSNSSNDATVTINVTPINDAPIAVDDSVSTLKDAPISINVLFNDFDVDGDLLTVASTTPTNLGGTIVIEVDNTLSYTPPVGYIGADGFSYSIDDGNGGTASALVAVTVTDSIVSMTASFQEGVDGYS